MTEPVIHPLVENILATRRTKLPDGSDVSADSFIPRDECVLLYEMIAMCRATRAVEVGMAYGVSTLCIADAIHRNAQGEGTAARLVSIDSHQSISFRGAGAHLIARAGYSSLLALIEETSQAALPRLVAAGERFQFGFIDGWHTFDHALVDFFFIDLLLEAGGIVVFDDVGYPAINALVRFVLANRDYELVKTNQYLDPRPLGLRIRVGVKRMLRRLARTDRDPSEANTRLFRTIELAHAVALRKRGGDRRPFDHFERF